MNQTVFFILMGGIMTWSIYRRVRRNVGRQRLRPRYIVIRLVLFCVLSAFLIIASLQNAWLLAGFGGGLASGALLGLLGLQLTRFETTAEGHFYTPDTRIGVGLSLLVAGRMLYRMIILSNHSLDLAHPPMQSPLTFLIVGLMFGYFVVYYVGLFVHTRDKN